MTPDQEETLVWAVEKLTVSLQVIAGQLVIEADHSNLRGSTGRVARGVSKSVADVNFELCEAFPYLRSMTDTKEKP